MNTTTRRSAHRDVRAGIPIAPLKRDQAYVLWPVRMWRTHVETRSTSSLDVFANAVLGLAATGMSVPEELAETLQLPASLCVEVLRRLRIRKLLDAAGPTDAGLQLLKQQATPKVQTRTAIELEHTGTLLPARRLHASAPGLCGVKRSAQGELRLLTAQNRGQFTFELRGNRDVQQDRARIERELARRDERALQVECVGSAWLVTLARVTGDANIVCSDPFDADRTSPQLTSLLRRELDEDRAEPVRQRLLSSRRLSSEQADAAREARLAYARAALTRVRRDLGTLNVSAPPERILIDAWTLCFECRDHPSPIALRALSVELARAIEATLSIWLSSSKLPLSRRSARAVGSKAQLIETLGSFAQKAEGHSAAQLDLGQSLNGHRRAFERNTGAARALLLAALWAWGHDEAEWLNPVFGSEGTLGALLRAIESRNTHAHHQLHHSDTSPLDLETLERGLHATTLLFKHLRNELNASQHGQKTKHQTQPVHAQVSHRHARSAEGGRDV